MTSVRKKIETVGGRLQCLLMLLVGGGSFMLLGLLLKYSVYGIDFTDESFYLVWLSNPFIYAGSVTQFGFIYYPLYSLLNGDIAALRCANILITFVLAWCLAYFFLASLCLSGDVKKVSRLVVSAGLAVSACSVFDTWLPTPSYNSLTLQALLLTAVGLVLAEKNAHRKSVLGWLLIGVGGWLAFMAKPSTAVALAVGVFVYLIWSSKFSLKLLALTVVSVVMLLIISALLIDGSVGLFCKRLLLGVELAGHLGGGYALVQLLRIDDFQLGLREKIVFLITLVMLFSSIFAVWQKNIRWYFFGWVIACVFFMFSAVMVFGYAGNIDGLGRFQGLLFFSLVLAVILVSVVVGRLEIFICIPAPQWAIACLFLAMPHIYAFGTNGNYWQAGSAAGVFWILAVVVFIAPLVRARACWAILLPLALATQAVTATLLKTGLEVPYRQPQPLRLNESVVEFGPQKSTLVLSEGYATYINAAVDGAREAGLGVATPMLDLSGQSPGILYALGAENIGQAWTIGGYPGSLRLAGAALEHVPCEKIAAAWVLLEPDGPRSISSELMFDLGADFPNAYEFAASWNTAEGAGGYLPARAQVLYKPVRPWETMQACQTLRAKGIQ